jgi:hypothetical protein
LRGFTGGWATNRETEPASTIIISNLGHSPHG